MTDQDLLFRQAGTDTFLDKAAADYLGQLWTERLATPSPQAHTILAEHQGELVGMAHTLLDASPAWGALLDNLHVRHTVKRQGIGTRLLARTARALRGRSGLYLWVLEQNTMAQAFYTARGGEVIDRGDVPPPGGDPTHLNGRPTCLRYAWRDPSVLHNHD